ncbi:methylated-DNA--[protein]-cysteine S-methyltransferase [Denitrobaculum tricleocarpae]|uniref:Methylated-DNA--protein-cysteine methyltransferase n=1 Tax=Denitrobaculum tricleocarpae TaxID=2591009 RepID=A0A545TRX1_9PROT|nr:methylated-DNA--[protein]-cysteine S-methyltransferase [Denitrobaculum tricleocarpae]TQV79977.1 methylated-DNA--[protein]-cysteine S-methyltransferase [Denitrobaculum tricleocarpae]
MDTAEVTIDSPFGALLLRASDEAITRLTWLMEEDGALRHAPNASRPLERPNSPAHKLLAEATRQLEAYFEGTLRDFALPLAPAGTAFQRRVWHEMAKIPYGETMTYGQLADKSDSVARAVGGACGANPIPIIIPCHRVLGGGGKLGGFSGGLGPDSKRALLEHEGVLTPGFGF